MNWSDFEGIFEEAILKANSLIEIEEDPRISDEISSINKAIENLETDFSEYLLDEYSRWKQRSNKNQLNPFFKDLVEDENTDFINFNYTNTITDICESFISPELAEEIDERVHHIHGSLNDKNILFGGGFTDKEDIDKIQHLHSLANDKLFRIKKDDKLTKTRLDIQELIMKEDTELTVYVMGHSLMGSDFIFLSKIIEKAKQIYIFYFENDYIWKMEGMIKKFGSKVVEKITLVPFFEMALSESVIFKNYDEYEVIKEFIPERIPKDNVFSNVTMTKNHFLFKNLSSLTITPENLEKIIVFLEVLNDENSILKRVVNLNEISFTDNLTIEDYQKLIQSNSLMQLISRIQELNFNETDISTDFLSVILEKGKRIKKINLENCIFVSEETVEFDIAITKKLETLVIDNCYFNNITENKKKKNCKFISKNMNNLKKIKIINNVNVGIEPSVMNLSCSLEEFEIAYSDSDQDSFSEEVHLKNLESLFLHWGTGLSNLTIGDNIQEIYIYDYTEDSFELSKLIQSENNPIILPNLKLIKFQDADNDDLHDQISIDALLNIFSQDVKIVVNNKVKTALDMYQNQMEFNMKQATRFTKAHKLFKSSSISLVNYSSKEKYTELSDIFKELNNSFDALINYNNDNYDEEKLKPLNERMKTIEEYINIYRTIENLYSEEDVVEIQDSEEICEEPNKYNMNGESHSHTVEELERKEIQQEDILLTRQHSYIEDLNPILDRFANNWFVSYDELYSSAVQYKSSLSVIPNIGSIISSANFDEYKVLHPNVNKLKYSQEMKREWKEELDRNILPLNEKLHV